MNNYSQISNNMNNYYPYFSQQNPNPNNYIQNQYYYNNNSGCLFYYFHSISSENNQIYYPIVVQNYPCSYLNNYQTSQSMFHQFSYDTSQQNINLQSQQQTESIKQNEEKNINQNFENNINQNTEQNNNDNIEQKTNEKLSNQNLENQNIISQIPSSQESKPLGQEINESFNNFISENGENIDSQSNTINIMNDSSFEKMMNANLEKSKNEIMSGNIINNVNITNSESNIISNLNENNNNININENNNSNINNANNTNNSNKINNTNLINNNMSCKKKILFTTTRDDHEKIKIVQNENKTTKKTIKKKETKLLKKPRSDSNYYSLNFSVDAYNPLKFKNEYNNKKRTEKLISDILDSDNENNSYIEQKTKIMNNISLKGENSSNKKNHNNKFFNSKRETRKTKDAKEKEKEKEREKEKEKDLSLNNNKDKRSRSRSREKEIANKNLKKNNQKKENIHNENDITHIHKIDINKNIVIVNKKNIFTRKKIFSKNIEDNDENSETKEDKKNKFKKIPCSLRINEVLDTYANVVEYNNENLEKYYPHQKDKKIKFLLYRNKYGEIYAFTFKYQVCQFIYFNCYEKHCRGIGRYNMKNKNFMLCQNHSLSKNKHKNLPINKKNFVSTTKMLKNNLNIDCGIIFE